ncbi:MAG: Type 1 glutamine amidotransferase-like domain-containing protein [Weeksellaceae bacterium]
MKLLLTSNGLTTSAIQTAFFELVSKKPADIKLAFIPTAADPEEDKTFVDQTIKQLLELGLAPTMIDLKNCLPETIAQTLSSFDVIYVNGGNTFYLLYWALKSGFYEYMKSGKADHQLYVGSSAGSMLTNPTIEVAYWKGWADPSVVKLESLNGLNLVDFYIFAHYGEQWQEVVEEKKKTLNGELYALEDKQALSVINKKVNLI